MWCSRCRSYRCDCTTEQSCKACKCDPCTCCSSCGCCSTCTCSRTVCDCQNCHCFLHAYINMVKDQCHDLEFMIGEYEVISRQLDCREDLLGHICQDILNRICDIKRIFTGCAGLNLAGADELYSSILSFYKGDRSNFFFCLSHQPKLIVFVVRDDNHITINLVSRYGMQRLAAEGESGAKKPVIGFKNLPKGWTVKSFKKFYKTITTEDPDHPFSACVAKLKDKFDDPKRFCSKMLDSFYGTTKWRNKKIREKIERRLGIFNPDAGPPKVPVK